MKTLVTGSTGFLGSAVLRELLDDGREVKVLVRRGTRTANIDGLDVEIAYGDLRDLESIRSALIGCDILYHVAAYYSLWDRDQELIYEINVEGTRKILQAAHKKGLEKIVYTSTVGCIGLNEDTTPATENTFFNKKILEEKFKSLGIVGNNVVFSCGSSVTASVLGIAYYLINNKYIPTIYVGSWSEYGKIK